jgi:hypothetical protein
MERLRKLVDAWNRSHFIFKPPVTRYLRQLWLDAVDADYAAKVCANEAPGNKDEWRQKGNDLFKKHMEIETLRNVFLSHLKVR